MTPERASRRIERFAADLEGALARGLSDVLGFAMNRAIWWSSGPYSSAALARMGHPFARAERGQVRTKGRAGTWTRLEPARINVQSGDLIRSWMVLPPRGNGRGGICASLYNAAPEARFLYDTRDEPKWPDRGTATMIGRPLPEKVLAEVEPRAVEILERALGRRGGG